MKEIENISKYLEKSELSKTIYRKSSTGKSSNEN